MCSPRAISRFLTAVGIFATMSFFASTEASPIRDVGETRASRITPLIYFTQGFPETGVRFVSQGAMAADLIPNAVMSAAQIQLDPANGKMYWIDSENLRIRRSDLNGAAVEDLVNLGAPNCTGLALDLVNGKLYYTVDDPATGDLRRANLDGSMEESFLAVGPVEPNGIAISDDLEMVYWAETTQIRRARLDGTGVPETVVPDTEGFTDIGAIAISEGAVTALLFAGSRAGGDTLVVANRDFGYVQLLLAAPSVGQISVTDAGDAFYTDSSGVQRMSLTVGVPNLVVPGTTFVGAAFDPATSFLYTTDPIERTIRRFELVNRSGIHSSAILHVSVEDPRDVFFDLEGSKVYWVDDNRGAILRANSSSTLGTGIEELIAGVPGTGDPDALDIDLVDGKIYWTEEGGQIYRADLDGTGDEPFLDEATEDIALDVSARKIYWTTFDGIERANLDRTGVEPVVTGLANAPTSLVVNRYDGKIYWTSADGDEVRRADLDGTNEELLPLTSRSPNGIQVDPFAGRLFWAERPMIRDASRGAAILQSSNLDGTDPDPFATVNDVVISDLSAFTVPQLSVCPELLTTVPPCGRFAVPVVIRDAPTPLQAFGFDVIVEDPGLTLADVTRASFTGTWTEFGFNINTPDSIRVGAFNDAAAIPNAPSDTLAILLFDADPTAMGGATIRLTGFVDDLETAIDCEITVPLSPAGTGDVDANGFLTPGDGLCAFLCFMNGGFVPAECDFGTGREECDADVDCNTICTPNDAQAILRRYACDGAPLGCFAQGVPPCPGTVTGDELEPRVAELRLEVASPISDGIFDVPLSVVGQGRFDAFGLDLRLPEGFEVVGFDASNASAAWPGFAYVADGDVVRFGGFDGTGWILSPGEATLLGSVRVERSTGTVFEPELVATFDDLAGATLVMGENDTVGVTSPVRFELARPRPNPSRGTMALEYAVSRESRVLVEVFNVHGQRVRTLVDGAHAPGLHEAVWSGADDSGARVGAGVYFVRMQADGFEQRRRVVRLR